MSSIPVTTKNKLIVSIIFTVCILISYNVGAQRGTKETVYVEKLHSVFTNLDGQKINFKHVEYLPADNEYVTLKYKSTNKEIGSTEHDEYMIMFWVEDVRVEYHTTHFGLCEVDVQTVCWTEIMVK